MAIPNKERADVHEGIGAFQREKDLGNPDGPTHAVDAGTRCARWPPATFPES